MSIGTYPHHDWTDFLLATRWRCAHARKFPQKWRDFCAIFAGFFLCIFAFVLPSHTKGKPAVGIGQGNGVDHIRKTQKHPHHLKKRLLLGAVKCKEYGHETEG